MNKVIAYPFLLAALFLAGGCEGPLDDREGVSGNITLKGKPLENGTITFFPVSTGTQSGTTIAQGKYAILRDKGLSPGKYKVFISSPDGKTPEAVKDALPGPSGNFTSVDRVPAAFNTESKTEVSVQKGAPNTFSFDIP
ncbi:MAG: carboxypeptidase regulatory-like domain-containing protein [Gemmataceae bacterium]|nr:carboxypeptidase regulatory-like domain-containing protein [Gemmataceae bacterium]